MCTTCGCEQSTDHAHHSSEKVTLEKDILTANNQLAERIRGFLEARSIFALNLMSSPGAGKTTLLEKTIQMLADTLSIYVIEGDQQTSNDADRIRRMGVPAIQINTGNGCHLEAQQVYHALRELNPDNNALLFIENVGNLVCPAIFDLGENKKVVIISPTEGEDKPVKYPQMFFEASVCVINKIDLTPFLQVDINLLKENLLKVNHHLILFEVSALTGEGMENWCNWILESLLHIQTVSQQHSFFDERAVHWDEENPVDPQKITSLLSLLDIQPTDHILDVGCGTGILVPFLEEKADKGEIMAVDLSEGMIQQAKKKFNNHPLLKLQVMNIETDELKQTFDKIILFRMFPHLEKKTATIAHLFSHLKPGGKLLIAHDRGRDFLNKMHVHQDNRIQDARLISIETQRKNFEEVGLQVKEAYEDEQSYYLLLEKPL